MATTRGRLVQVNQVVPDQVDFFQSDGFTRVTALTPANLVSRIFFNNALQPWPLVSGLNIPDAQVVAGKIYFNEIPGSPGYYSVRFRPNAVGYWRNVLVYAAGTQEAAQDFDAVPSQPTAEGGLSASFIKPSC